MHCSNHNLKHLFLIIHFIYSLNPIQGRRGTGAYPSCHCVRDGVHPGQIASPSLSKCTEYLYMFHQFCYGNQPQSPSPLIHSLHGTEGEMIVSEFLHQHVGNVTNITPHKQT